MCALYLVILILIYISRVSWVNIQEYNCLYASNTMLAVNDQLIWYIAKTWRSFSPMYNVNYFFGHFKPILYFFALLYKIKPGPETLLFTQTLFLGLGGIAVYLMAKKRGLSQTSSSGKVLEECLTGGSSRIGTVPYGSLIVTLAYLFTMTLISYTSFHTIIIAIPFLLWAVYFIERDSAKMSFLFCALALACKENVSFVVFALGVYVLIFKKDSKIRKSLGYSLIIFSLLWFYVTVYIIMPIFAVESRTEFLTEINAIYSYLNPSALLKTFFSFNNILYLFSLLLPFGFLPLFSPFSLVALPQILLNIFSSNPAQTRIFNYYSAIPMAIFLIASINAAGKKKWLPLYLLLFSFFTLLFFGPSPEYKIDRHSQIGREFIKAIPKDASVYSQVGLASHLSQRKKLNIYLADYNYNRNKDFSLRDYEYAILDLKGDKFPDGSPAGEKYFARFKQLIDVEGMGLVKREDGFILLKRPEPNARPALNNLAAWRGIFITKEFSALPVLYRDNDIGLIRFDFPSESKQGGLFWVELGLVKLKEFSEEKQIKIEFRGKRKSFILRPQVAHGILKPSFWKTGEVVRHIETVRFSPFLWPGTYEIFFESFKIGEILIKRR